MSAENGLIAGAGWAWIAFRDANGYPTGVLDTVNGVAFANGAVTHAYRIKHPVTYTPPSPTRDQVERRGGLARRGVRDMGISSYGLATLVLDAYDEQLNAYLTRSVVDTATMSGWTMSAPNDNLASLPRIILGITIGITTEDGSDDWLTIVYGNCQLRPAKFGAGQDSGTNPNPLSYEIVPDTSTRTGIGRLLSGTALAVVDNTDTYICIRYADPITLSTYKDDASATSFILGYRPRSTDETGAATNSITKNGTTQAVTSVTLATGAVVITAGSAADLWVVAYPTRYQAI